MGSQLQAWFSALSLSFTAFFSHAQSGLISSSGQGLPVVKTFQITFASLLFHALDMWDNRAPKMNKRDEMEIVKRE